MIHLQEVMATEAAKPFVDPMNPPVVNSKRKKQDKGTNKEKKLDFKGMIKPPWIDGYSNPEHPPGFDSKNGCSWKKWLRTWIDGPPYPWRGSLIRTVPLP